MKKQCKYLLFSLCLLLAWSCEKEEAEIDQTDYQTYSIENTEVASFDDTTVKEYRGQLAKMLSIACAKSPDMINVLTQSSTENKRTKGYYEDEFFFNLDKNEKRTSLNNESYKELLINTFEDAQKILEYLEEHDPGLAILRVDRPNKSVDQVKFYVNNNDFDDNDDRSIVSYYQNGELKHQTIGEGADNLSFVVRQSEAYYSNERLALSFNKGIKNQIEKNEVEFINMSDKGYIVYTRGQSVETEGGNNTGGGVTSNCERDLVDGTEHFYRFRARESYDSFINGSAGEFKFYFIFYQGETPTFNGQQLVAQAGNDPLIVNGVMGNNQWIYPDYPILTWLPEEYGDKILFVAYEDDFSLFELSVSVDDEIEFPIPGTDSTIAADIQFNFTVGNTDDFIGIQYVEYCQPTLNDALPENETYKFGNNVDFHQIEHDGGLLSCRYQFFKNNFAQGLLGEINDCEANIYNLTNGHPQFGNDEIRSMRILEAPAGKVIRVFDNSQGSTGDDYAVITVLQDIFGGTEITIGTFEESFSNNYVNVEYCCGGNLDGKISRLEFN